MIDIKSHAERIKDQGYTLVPDLIDQATREGLKQDILRLHEESKTPGPPSWWFGNAFESSPTERMLPTVAHPILLDLVEQLMGPFAQLDNLTLAAMPPAKPDQRGIGWHRDRWAFCPEEPGYRAPLAMNAIFYLDGLDDQMGPLRVIPKSHRQPVFMEGDTWTNPHPDELLIKPGPRDVVVIHHALLHSGTANHSDRLRFFFSIYYNKSWLRATDHHTGPRTQAVIAQARARNDHRTLRLFGIEEQLQARCNHAFRTSDEGFWKEWAEADRKALRMD